MQANKNWSSVAIKNSADEITITATFAISAQGDVIPVVTKISNNHRRIQSITNHQQAIANYQ